MRGHSILVGYGRVGRLVAAAIADAGAPFIVIESDARRVEELRGYGIAHVEGNAASGEILRAASPEYAERLVIAIPNAFEAGRIVRHARKANPAIVVVARAHSDAEIHHLKELGADTVIMGERQIALEMIAELARQRAPATS
jgi:CPA2 family monovalent cation:H+ antiporter-2